MELLRENFKIVITKEETRILMADGSEIRKESWPSDDLIGEMLMISGTLQNLNNKGFSIPYELMKRASDNAAKENGVTVPYMSEELYNQIVREFSDRAKDEDLFLVKALINND